MPMNRRYRCRKCEEDFEFTSEAVLEGHLNSKHSFACGPVVEIPLGDPSLIVATVHHPPDKQTRIISWGKF